uniref:Acetylornithine/succinyldiaminopimelate/putrescine aminotransferase n=1 Tax=Candidatus Kentrum sp. MB TaxID=2138164 RepID=A0A450XP00_9GAMM|nr:MAG: Acetylornithine/succinyldiaminopimelate/putrescine aminotransferase [Candidatus Kentron sp. MB]VFK35419.1 MAG: Acetylornithine/succinyldiaminopimelate/putrescine aminotransferase [Candidatus Kentron sp. MB]VFK77280.1 MAG: Acetylornithine/succinyldiaminopimelate/putrescine aminotransferase [Candidatus Kentron sp. MB]
MASTKSLFRDATKETIGLLEELNQRKKPIFIVPTKFISAEAAQVGYLLDAIYHLNHGAKHNADRKTEGYKSFFCNSRFEALQGALKIARHRQMNRYRYHGGKILICDPTKAIEDYFLFPPGQNESLFLPGVETFDILEEMEQRLTTTPVAACFSRLDKTLDWNALPRIRSECSRNNIRFGLDFSEMELAEIADLFQDFNPDADLYVWGEQLTNREIPFGVFSMSHDVYRPWNTIQNSLLHSSTYSGNLLALNKVKQVLMDGFGLSAQILKTCADIAVSDENKKKYFSAHVNPNLEKLYGLAGYDLDVQEASGCYLTVKSKDQKESQVLLDCLSGGALGIFGHNPADLVPAVLSLHDRSHDYWRDLAAELARLTGFEHALPSVSGATAVENGLFMALSAQDSRRRKIIVFDNNYAGKLLLPLVASPSSLQPSFRFAPLYRQVVVIDPFAKDAQELLLSEIRSGEVGVIWFEYIRGSDGRQIPDPLIDIIERNRERHRYYIGIDEILMGLYRAGPLFSHHKTNLRPDIVTLSKGLTYMSFPVGVTLIRSTLHDRVQNNAPDVLSKMQTRYTNQLGAHIALHCLNRLQEEDIRGNVERQSRYLQEQLERLSDEHRNLIDHIEMAGLFFRIYPKTPWWIQLGGTSGKTAYLLFLTKCWKKAGVFSFFDTRLMPSLCLSEKEIDMLLASARKVFAMRPLEVFLTGLGREK